MFWMQKEVKREKAKQIKMKSKVSNDSGCRKKIRKAKKINKKCSGLGKKKKTKLEKKES